jgi:transitional endoplasmic reticulum ATPase
LSYLSFESTEPALVDSQSSSYSLDNESISLGKIRADVWFNSSFKSRVQERVNGDAPVASKSSKLGDLVVGYENLREKLHSSVVLPLLDAVSMALRDSSSSNGGIDSEQKLASSSTSSSSSSLPSSATPLKVSPCRGLLLHGPSGCGKTLLARSLAAEANLALIHVQCPQLLSKYVGDSEAGLREVFRTARAMAPSLLLLDDIDAIAKARSGLEVRLATTTQGEKNEKKTATSSAVFSLSSQPSGSNAVLERLLSTLLNELDGIGLRSSSLSKANLPILVVGTCSESSTLDAALLRSGRLELHVLVHSPGLSDRIAILQASAQKVKLSFNANEYLTEFAKELSGRSCAQVSKILSEASEKPEVNIEYLKRVI